MSQVQNLLLEEEIDEAYEPTQREIEEYAEWLGMDVTLEEDRGFLWIARQGLKAPLPSEWKPCQSGDTGDIFYYNFETEETVWDHPCDEYFRKLFQDEKDASRPRVIGSLYASPRDSDAVMIEVSNLAGDKLASIQLEGPSCTLRGPCTEFEKQLGPELYLVLPDGRQLPSVRSKARGLLDLPLWKLFPLEQLVPPEELLETARRQAEGSALMSATLRAPAGGLPPLRRLGARGSLGHLPKAVAPRAPAGELPALQGSLGPLLAKRLRLAPGKLAGMPALPPRLALRRRVAVREGFGG